MLLENIVMVVFGLFLVYEAIQDVRKRTVGIYLIIMITVLLIVANVVFNLISMQEMVFGGMLGAVFAVISKITKQSIGYGDSAIITTIGLGFGLCIQIQTLLVSTMLLFILSVILLALRKMKVKDSLPFVPFLLVGYIVTAVMKIV